VSAGPAKSSGSALGIDRGGAALITGASSGVALLLTALPAEHDRLDAIADELVRAHGIRCLAVGADLAQADGPERLRDEADRLGFEPDLLVNSAGVGASGRFADAPVASQLTMIRVNAEAVAHLCAIYLPRMTARRAGAVINVASTAAFQPLPYFSVYAATKAFVLSLGEALWAESRLDGVRVVSVCSGPVETPFHGGPDAGDGAARTFLRRRYMTPQRVVESGLAAVQRDRPVVVLRMPLVGLLHYPVGVLRAVIPLRVRLQVAERLGRWVYGPAGGR
jgi:uncharacterized protein